MRIAPPGLEVQACFSGTVRYGFDATMVQKTVPIKDNFLDALFQGALGYQFADESRCRDFAGELRLLFKGPFDTGRGNQGTAAPVIDDLSIYMARASEHAQPRPFRRS